MKKTIRNVIGISICCCSIFLGIYFIWEYLISVIIEVTRSGTITWLQDVQIVFGPAWALIIVFFGIIIGLDIMDKRPDFKLQKWLRVIIGLLICIASIVLGLYGGVYLFFIKPIMNLANGMAVTPAIILAIFPVSFLIVLYSIAACALSVYLVSPQLFD